MMRCTDHAQKGVRRVFLRYVRLGVAAEVFFYFWVKKNKAPSEDEADALQFYLIIPPESTCKMSS